MGQASTWEIHPANRTHLHRLSKHILYLFLRWVMSFEVDCMPKVQSGYYGKVHR